MDDGDPGIDGNTTADGELGGVLNVFSWHDADELSHELLPQTYQCRR